jgi:DNA-binding FadR family transcriptional regulator
LWFDAGDVSINEVDEARYIVERACVGLAAERRTDEDLVAMRKILDSAAKEGLTLKAFLGFDVAFHRLIARAARNRLLELPMAAIHLVRPKTNRLLQAHDRHVVSAQHLALYRAIETGDSDAAQRALDVHVKHLARERAAALARQQRPGPIPVREIDT